ncbi:MAG: Gfo/Idh/MocA family oxidoreductase [Planctomycetia bacterium]|nr:Gfo/Idh/MocA family oxidoreductase [Planctomycetia bacterium]
MKKSNRRQFLRRSATASIAAIAGLRSLSVAAPAFCSNAAPNEKLNLAFVGVWGQARTTMGEMQGENFYALCDVDENRLGKAAQNWSDAKKFNDYRKMLETLDDKIDAVVVSTPDHSHAAPSVQAMRMKKHCYCEKPLAHDVRECRVMQDVAAEMKVATQMGTQPNSWPNYYETEELVKSGAIGTVSEVHVWTQTGDATGYIQGVGGKKDVGIPLGVGWGMRPDQMLPEGQPIPQGLDWDLWLGPAEAVPYHDCFFPGNWRRWWRFGSGQLGNFGCHYMNLPVRTLGLLNCRTVEAWGPAVNSFACPEYLRVKYEFPNCTLWWYDGASLPELAVVLNKYQIPAKKSGILFVGSEGCLYANYTEHILYPEAQYADFKAPEPFIPRSVGHYKEFLDACKANDPKLARCPFSYAGRLTETALLGTLAYRTGEKLEWDAENFRTNSQNANELLATTYRKGWRL